MKPCRRAAYGVARLVVVLFAVVGLAVTYGTGQSRPVIPCTAHDVPAAAKAVAATAHVVMSGAGHDDPNRHGPADAGVPLAALVFLLTLGLVRLGGRIWRRPVRSGRMATAHSPPRHHAPSLAFLQVLRL
ncbi:hypothetical protein [Actinomadura alba]|uniref:hypothetical protein n=1 Tax=Actinomadura alba TaxID=406431 RepID=UPI0031D4E027